MDATAIASFMQIEVLYSKLKVSGLSAVYPASASSFRFFALRLS